MWKQFLELIPHLSRLLPHIDRLIQQRSSGDDTQKKTLEQFQQMKESLRADLAQATASHASLYRQLNDQGEKMSRLAADQHDSRAALQSAEAHILKLESSLNTIRGLLLITLLFAAFTFLALLIFHFHR
jgi:septal ring factor EnvC (AmiA/AmiB activator)